MPNKTSINDRLVMFGDSTVTILLREEVISVDQRDSESLRRPKYISRCAGQTGLRSNYFHG